jgi:asparagine synthase (glutamine-hydrolysing)
MCGINGIIVRKGSSENVDLKGFIQVMNNKIIHRGPDDDGKYFYEPGIAMGMRRLSIIDLAHGKQPIYNDDSTLVITFNGEIYNFLELRKSLQVQGVSFKTESDTEVILRLYEKHGESCVLQLNGMFAFAIHDLKKNRVFIARDRFGEKPLYYYPGKDQFIWASELKSIIAVKPELKTISKHALNLYLSLTYIPAPFSIYEKILKLKPGCSVVLNTEDLSYTITQYWDIDIEQQQKPVSYQEAKKQIRDTLFDSVEKRMIADVPLGVFLSGGVDSTIIASIMARLSNQRIKTFSVGSTNKRYDESERARQVATHIGSEHHEFILNYDDVLDSLDKILLNYDEPFADPSSLPTYYVSSKTVEHVKVALTGDGGDEVFGGYNKYLIHTYGAFYKKMIPGVVTNKIVKPLLHSSVLGGSDSKSRLGKIRKMIDSLADGVVPNHLNIIALGFKPEAMSQLLRNDLLEDYTQVIGDNIALPYKSGIDPLKVARYIDKNISLDGDMLVKVDRASMLCSLECRAPFLDHRLMEYTYSLPDEYLLKGNNKKRILKDTFEDLLPNGFFNAPKSGFEIPIAYWFRNELKHKLMTVLSEDNLQKHGFFNENYVKRLISEHMNAQKDHSYKLWTLFSFQLWYNSQQETVWHK